MKNLYFIFAILILVASCKKKEQDPYVHVSGRILKLADSTADANDSFCIYQWQWSGSLNNRVRRPHTQTFHTDANGYFTVDFEEKDGEYIAVYWTTKDEYNELDYDRTAFVKFFAKEGVVVNLETFYSVPRE